MPSAWDIWLRSIIRIGGTSMKDKSVRHEFLSKNVSTAIKGIAALMVLFHHFYQRTYFISQPYIGKLFEILGYLAVSLFFFLSGYGLCLSYKNKKESYIDQFPKKRLLPFYSTYLLFVLITLIEKIMIGQPIAISLLIRSFFFYGTIVAYGWYFQTILLFYILFYLIFKCINNDKSRFIILSSLIVIYTVACHLLNVASAIYVSSLSFPLGVYWCSFDGLADKIFHKKIMSFLLSGMGFFVLVAASFATANKHLRYILRILSSPFFVVFALIAISAVYHRCEKLLVNPITGWLGKHSLEIYASQGMFFTLFRSDLIYVNNSYVYIALVFIFTMIFSPILHLAVKLVNHLLGKNAN